MAAERPRRATRVPAKYQTTKREQEIRTVSMPATKKRKTSPSSSQDVTSPEILLTNPKSPLVNVDLFTLINYDTWSALSQDSRALLATMLPPTVFPFYRPSLGPNHPANKQLTGEVATNASQLDIDAQTLASQPDPSFFIEPFFEAATKTFQDHLYSGWLTPAHEALVREYSEKLQRGTIHATWKDDIWAAEHPIINGNATDPDGLAGDASTITLKDLVKHSILRVGDVLAYRRHFSQFNGTVAKDALIHSISPSTYSITVLVAPSTQTHLPFAHLQHPDIAKDTSADDADNPLRSMTITNPSQLETALLDIDGSSDKSRRRNANAWKSFSLWRWRDGEVPNPSLYAEDAEEAARGYRDYRGTLFYLRGCFYDVS